MGFHIFHGDLRGIPWAGFQSWGSAKPFTESPRPHPGQGGVPLRRHTDVAGGIAVLTQGLANVIRGGKKTTWKLLYTSSPPKF